MKPSESHPAMIFYHGAGFTNNKVNTSQFQHHAAHFASLGITTVLAEYRPLEIEGLFSPIESLKNAKSVIRWTRQNSRDLGINPNKIITVGASAGGYLCLCAAMIDQFNDPMDNLYISSKPNAMILFNGGVDSKLLADLFPDLKEPLLSASPIKEVKEGLPPSLFFHGTEDKNIPIEDVSNFIDRMTERGNNSKLISFEGLGHGFFNYGNMDNEPYEKTLKETEEFLRQIDFLG
ncbi:alpha/beta hydrolase [Paenibacillus lutimineralis]|uniref:Alpha/beta hydrolase n=1 Tax=Paenibacillus lutimineralis TaxID=2707005 RepID=A0A3S9V1Z2_9BACL|nr:alpha/beta hydrolase [Paenibacillus lutimineralis]AZS16605.1 alpha/beta hydrolase [Paenibacillus lutimineralis]